MEARSRSNWDANNWRATWRRKERLRLSPSKPLSFAPVRPGFRFLILVFKELQCVTSSSFFPVRRQVMTFKSQLHEFSHYRNAYLLALSAAMGSIFYGWDIGLIGGILSLPSFQSSFGIDKKTASQRADLNGNIVSVLQAGCLCVM